MIEYISFIIALIGAILGIVSTISTAATHKLMENKIKKQAMNDIIIRHKIVLKDGKEKLYTLEKDGELVKKIVLDTGKKTIIYLTIGKELYTPKTKVANNAESLAFNCAINSIPKDTKKNKSSANIAKDIDLMMKLLQKKAKSNTFSYFALIFSLIVEFFLVTLNPLFLNDKVILFTCILIILSFANQLILKYRVKKGLYGTSYLEAKEIISFIFNEQNNSNNGTGKTKLVFPREEIEQYVLLNRNRSEEHAQ